MLLSNIGEITDDDIDQVEDFFRRITNKTNFSFDSERRNVLKSLESIDVNACPGSGKTTMVAAKLIILAKKWPYKNKGICIISHTNAAKDEIINMLRRHPNGHIFLQYPHFIGTIQDFDHRFIALPYLRSFGISTFVIDNEQYVREINKLLKTFQFSWLKGCLKGLGQEDNQISFLKETYYLESNNQLAVNFAKRPIAWKKLENFNKAQGLFKKLKKLLCKDGIFLYRDMFTLGLQSIENNQNLPSYIRARFPMLIIDEMQDTEDFQEALLSNIFPLGQNKNSIVQRFGDTNQAIYNSTNSSDNDHASFPNSQLQKRHDIVSSHRFGKHIGNLIQHLAVEKGDPRICLGDENLTENCKPIIITVDNNKYTEVLNTFAEIIKNKLPNNNYADLKIYAIAANAKEGTGENTPLRLIDYYPNFYKKTMSKEYIPNTLQECLLIFQTNNSHEAYKLIKMVEGSLLKYLRLHGLKYNDGLIEKYYTFTTLHKALSNIESDFSQKNKFQSIIWKNKLSFLSPDLWQEMSEAIKTVINKSGINIDLTAWLTLTETNMTVEAINEQGSTNEYKFEDITIKVDTIHSVKGQTHDATLVLETGYRGLDFNSVASSPMSLKALPNNKVILKKHMKTLFVGCSRPSKLLCITVTPETAAVLKQDFNDFFDFWPLNK